MRVNAMEGALPLRSRAHAWHNTTGRIPSACLRLSASGMKLTQSASFIPGPPVHPIVLDSSRDRRTVSSELTIDVFRA
jgi:hypothetical protein